MSGREVIGRWITIFILKCLNHCAFREEHWKDTSLIEIDQGSSKNQGMEGHGVVSLLRASGPRGLWWWKFEFSRVTNVLGFQCHIFFPNPEEIRLWICHPKFTSFFTTLKETCRLEFTKGQKKKRTNFFDMSLCPPPQTLFLAPRIGNEKFAQTFFAQTFWTPPGVRDIPAKFPGHPGIPLFETQGRQTFEGGRELSGHHPLAWKTLTPQGGLRTQKVNLCALFSCLTEEHLCASFPGKNAKKRNPRKLFRGHLRSKKHA